MRIVAFADTHQFHDELVVPDGDVVVCAGDVCRGGERLELEIFLGWFEKLPHKHKVFVAGNHDGCLEGEYVDIVAAHIDVEFLEDRGVVIDGVSFYGAPWTPRFHDWFFMKDRGPALAERWALIPDRVDVLVTHGPPQGVLDDISRYRASAVLLDDEDDKHAGCHDLGVRVDTVRPKVHLFGHIHSQRGEVVGDNGVHYYNCTTNECELPCTVIDL